MMRKDLSSVTTLTELLEWRAFHTPENSAFIVEGRSYTYSWLWKQSLAFATLLLTEGVQDKERVVVVVPNSAAFFIAFYGCIFSGAIAVPIFPNAGTGRCDQIMTLCGSRHLILPDNSSEDRKKVFNDWIIQNDKVIHWVSELIHEDIVNTLPKVSAHDIAFIQYTSGSTDFPKGVPLTHFNLLSNIRQMVEAMNITAEDVFVSWLPVYHDMGLILKTMAPFYTRAGLVLLAEGLHRVHSWLKAIEQYKGTFVAAPDVAYRLCVKSIRRPGDYDITSLRVALNASERVQAETYSLFENTFNLKNVMISGYGLAEATVGVSMHPPGQPPVIDSDSYVASGRPLKGIQLKIDTKAADRSTKGEGEILVKGDGLMSGYYNNKKGAHPFDSEGFLRTGDIGYLDTEDNLFVLAREKNCIKHAGHTIYPDDVEQVVSMVENIRNVAAIGIENPHGDSESLYVFAESKTHRSHGNEKYHEMIVAIVQKINAYFGIKPGRVFIIKAKTIPRTPNGKLQHPRLKEMYLNRSDQLLTNILYPLIT